MSCLSRVSILLLCAPTLALLADDEAGRKARALNRRLLVLDTHVDTPTLALQRPGWRIDERHDFGHVDLPRMREAGLDAPFMVVYTPSELEPREAALHALRLCDLIHGWADDHPELTVARTPSEVIAAKKRGEIAMVLCMENGSPIVPGRLDLLRTYHRLGVRYLSLTHWRTNALCDSATDEPAHDGVSKFGLEVIQECNRLGVMLDVSHISDAAVRDHLRHSRAPMIASHSNARARCDHSRNLPDPLLREIASRGGVIQLNFAAQYLSDDYRRKDDARRAARKPREDEIEEQFAGDAARIREEKRKLRASQKPIEPPPFETWFAHLDHVVAVTGVDHVGLGSDFDGVGATPRGIADVTSLERVTRELLDRGWSEENIAKLYGGNLLRVWRAVEERAAHLR
ncbi:MAG: dipeptidase [Planctomycetota bacterium]|nr:dipeptidase [Planctomycetota bacterium]